MIYLLIYLGVGVLTLAIGIYAVFFWPSSTRQDEFATDDLVPAFLALLLWPMVYGMLIYDAINHAIDQRRSGNRDIVLWRRKASAESSVPELPPSSNDPDI